ncbi:MAG: serine hydrolase [Reichenbachiella sp.]
MKITKLQEQIPAYIHIILIAILFSSCQNEQSDTIDKYEQFLSQAHANGQFNGNALILKKGEIAFQGSFGISNIDPIDSLNQNSIFRLGSLSKQFTSMAIMQLKENGTLTYEQDVRDFIPEFPYEGITIKHLLNHVSGLPNHISLMNKYWKPELKLDDPERFISGNSDIIKMLVEKEPNVYFKPLEKWKYSNTGYVLLASIVAKASGIPFDRYLQEQIFEPSKMSNTVVYDYIPGTDPQMPNRVYGFRVGLNGKDTISSDSHFLNPAHGDGGIYSTTGDLLKWHIALYENKLISEEAKQEAFTPVILQNGDTITYGFGWGIGTSPTGEKIVGHRGGWLGFETFIKRGTEENTCFILLTNNSSIYMSNAITKGIENILYDQPYETPKLAISEAIGKVLMNRGVTAAIVEYKRLKIDKPNKYDFSQKQLNRLGYQLIGLDRHTEAVEIFQLNMQEFPQSARAHFSFGNALLAKGDTIQSLINFKKALAIDPTFNRAKEKIKQIEASTMSNI